MFIINPYRYAATGPQPTTDFFSSIHTSSLYITIGTSFDIISNTMHSSSVSYVVGKIETPNVMDNTIYNSVNVVCQKAGEFGTELNDSIKNQVDLRVT